METRKQMNQTNQTTPVKSTLTTIFKITGFGCLALSVCTFTFLLIVGLTCLSYSNTEIILRNAIAAEQKNLKSRFDEMWKTIVQQHEVAVEERTTFNQVMIEISKSQSGGEGKLVSFLKQAKIDVDSSLHKTVMTSISAQRAEFHRSQQKILQLKMQHDNIISGTISRYILAGRLPIDVQIVTSEKTEESFETGQDNDVRLSK